MAVPKRVLDAQGSWEGKSKLHLSWLPEDQRVTESNSTLTVEIDPSEAFAKIAYTWVHEGTEQRGLLLLAGDNEGAASGGWCDSWHQSGGVLALKGLGPQDGATRITGSYSAGDGPEWGWRIELDATDEEFTLRMFNISPEGDEEWAVEGRYRRA